MSAGTKIFLAVVALFIGTVIVYYAVIAPQNDSTIQRDADVEEGANDEQSAPNEFRNELPATSNQYNSGFSSNNSMTGASENTRFADSGTPSNSSWTAPIPRIVPGGGTSYDGGKDLPPTYGPPIPDDYGATLVQANTPISTTDTTPSTNRPALNPLYNPAGLSSQPAANNNTNTAAVAPVFSNYTVRPGDTLVYIAQDWFGDDEKWDLILKANPDLKNPDRLRVGQVLKLPPKNTVRLAETSENRPATSTTAGPGSYTVAAGDTLSVIAWKQYGQGSAWNLIYEANRQTIGDNPNRLKVGMKLTIPAKPVSR